MNLGVFTLFSPIRRIVFTALLALAVAMGIGRFAFTPMLPLMLRADGIAPADAAWLAAANYAGYFAGALMIPRLSLSPTLLLRVGLTATVVLTAAMGISHTPTLWLLWRALAGVASAWVLVGISTWTMAALAAQGHPEYALKMYTGVGTGIALSGLVCWLLATVLTPQQLWWGLALLALSGSLPALLRAKAVSVTPAPQPTHVNTTHPKHGTGMVIACYGITGLGYILPATWLPAQAQAWIANPHAFGAVWPLFGTTALLSVLLAMPLRRRFGNLNVWASAQAVLGIGVALPVLWPSFTAIVLSAVCVGSTFMVITMLGLQEARLRGGDQVQALIAKMTAAFALGQLAGPLLPQLLLYLGTAPVYAMPASLSVAALLLAFSCTALKRLAANA